VILFTSLFSVNAVFIFKANPLDLTEMHHF
jgi:hypothetical protein